LVRWAFRWTTSCGSKCPLPWLESEECSNTAFQNTIANQFGMEHLQVAIIFEIPGIPHRARRDLMFAGRWGTPHDYYGSGALSIRIAAINIACFECGVPTEGFRALTHPESWT
jgi:hypothetical protein